MEQVICSWHRELYSIAQNTVPKLAAIDSMLWSIVKVQLNIKGSTSYGKRYIFDSEMKRINRKIVDFSLTTHKKCRPIRRDCLFVNLPIRVYLYVSGSREFYYQNFDNSKKEDFSYEKKNNKFFSVVRCQS